MSVRSTARWSMACALLGCHHADTTATNDAGTVHTTPPHATVDAAAIAPAAATPGARATYEGHADGHGVEPPIHEFAPHVTADAWTAQGTIRLEIPTRSDGTVDGTVTLGDVRFAARGYRVATHVRATLDATALVDAGPSEDTLRGTLDGEMTADGASLRGTWQASSQGGVHRRQGTFEARRP